MTEPRRADWTTLFLPLAARGPTWLAAAAVALVSVLTMSRDLSWYDSAEFALVAVQGGLSHPPGHTFYTALAWVVAHLPLLPPLVGLNLLSAIPMALTVVPAVSLAEGLARRDGAGGAPRRWVIPAVIAGFMMHPALWETATRIEVYALAALLSLWTVARLAAAAGGELGCPRGWLAAGLALGLCAATNPMVATVTAIALAPAVVAAMARRVARWTRGLWLIGGCALGFFPPMAWIPMVAGRADLFVWGNPTGGEALRRYLAAADFAGKKVDTTWTQVFGNALDWLSWSSEVGLLPLLAVGLAAHLLWGRRAGLGRAAFAVSLTLIVLFLTTNAFFSPEIPDYLGYLATPFVLAAAGLAAVIARLEAAGGRQRALTVALAAAAALAVVVATPRPWARTRQRDHFARVLAQGALEYAPRDAIVIVESDHWVFPMLYLQEAEGLRPDVAILPYGLSGASWYWEHLHRRHRALERFPLRGPGRRPGRIRRFLAANPGRPILYERWSHAVRLGRLPGCAGPWLLHDVNACPDGESPEDALLPALEATLRELGRGSPGTDAVIANVSLHRGESLWRFGFYADAIRTIRAGVPDDLRPPLSLEVRERALGDGIPDVELPVWRGGPAIGAPERNLFVAGLLLRALGEEEGARAHFRAAILAGLDVGASSREATP